MTTGIGFTSPLTCHVGSDLFPPGALLFKPSLIRSASSIDMLSLLAQYFLNQLGGPVSQDITIDK